MSEAIKILTFEKWMEAKDWPTFNHGLVDKYAQYYFQEKINMPEVAEKINDVWPSWKHDYWKQAIKRAPWKDPFPDEHKETKHS